MASLVCSMSEMTPSVMMRRTWYCEPSVTWAAVLWGKGMGSLKHPSGGGQSTLLWDRWHLEMAKWTMPQCSPSHLVDDGSKVGRTIELDGAQALEIGLQHAFNAGTAGVVHVVVLGDRDEHFEGDHSSWCPPGCRKLGQNVARVLPLPAKLLWAPQDQLCPTARGSGFSLSPVYHSEGIPEESGERSCHQVGLWHQSHRQGRACHCRSPG